MYSLALAEPRIWPNDGLPDVGAPLAPPLEAAFVAVAPAVVPEVVVPPPHDAAITKANTRTAELPLFTTYPP